MQGKQAICLRSASVSGSGYWGSGSRCNGLCKICAYFTLMCSPVSRPRWLHIHRRNKFFVHLATSSSLVTRHFSFACLLLATFCMVLQDTSVWHGKALHVCLSPCSWTKSPGWKGNQEKKLELISFTSPPLDFFNKGWGYIYIYIYRIYAHVYDMYLQKK